MDDSKATTENPADASKPDESAKKWYVLKVQSNREKSIRESIIRRIKLEQMEEYFGEIHIPTEKVAETKLGVRKIREQKTLPGYMMIEMNLTDESWHLVRSTSGVGDFTGAAGKPIPMGDVEVRKWRGLETKEDLKGREKEEPRAVVRFSVEMGDAVKVKDGPFQGFEGVIDTLDEATGKVKVMMEIIGRSTEVELDHWQVEKV